MAKKNNNVELKYKIAVSGSAVLNHCGPENKGKFFSLGKEIARRGVVLLTGATTGTPQVVAEGAKKSGGFVIGLSPASSKIAHLKTYKLPVKYHDLIIYTGFDYSGRNLILTRSADAIIIICGRIGTLNEFTIAFEDNKPIGVLLGTGGTSALIPEIIKVAKRGMGKVVFASTPKALLDKLIPLIKKEEQKKNHNK